MRGGHGVDLRTGFNQGNTELLESLYVDSVCSYDESTDSNFRECYHMNDFITCIIFVHT